MSAKERDRLRRFIHKSNEGLAVEFAPRFVKYRTSSGNGYIFDSDTNEIIQVGEALYEIADDFRVLNGEEIVEKHRSLGEERVRAALAQIEIFQTQGILCGHAPEVSSRATRAICDGQEQSLDEYVGSHRGLLTLELTEKCNLRCDYCCYGEHYQGYRQHGSESISLEVAKRAIRDYLDLQPRMCAIGFYGGEPLLEFELLKQLVSYAEEYAGARGMKPDFTITTNGTLLNDEKIHYLVEHQFNILISLDGDRESHDRYRVFRDDKHPERRRGSYDVVMRNIRRFVELYSRYPTRGIALTLTATSDCDAINDVLKGLKPSISLSRVSVVQNADEEAGIDSALGIGASGPSPCETGSCKRVQHFPEMREGDAEGTADCSPNVVASEKRRDLPEFCDWREDDVRSARLQHARFREALGRGGDPDALRKQFPLVCTLMQQELGNFHHRVIPEHAKRFTIACRCTPGTPRLFCSTRGVLYPCERTDQGRLFELGSVNTGFDVRRAVGLIEVMRLLGDCGNCVMKRFCRLCPAVLSEQGESGRADGLAYQRICSAHIDAFRSQLKGYTELMEMYQEQVDRLLHRPELEDLKQSMADVELGLTEEQRREVELGIEELEAFV